MPPKKKKPKLVTPPARSVVSPVYAVQRVPIEKIRANAYNPNAVAPPEMALLELSILEDGYTMPIVCYYLSDEDIYEIVDGYHRYTTMLRNAAIRAREGGMLPVAVIDKDLSNRMASTIRHNRARGSHSIELMSNIVAELTRAGMSDGWILRHIGMDKDELLRLKQITGLADLFADAEFSEAWDDKTPIPLGDDGDGALSGDEASAGLEPSA
jgi:ParB-like chromosome segregation protein Spo0J